MLNYAIFILSIAGVYALLAQSVTLSWGMAGLVNLGLAGFFGIGAYVSAMTTKWGGAPVPLGVLLAIVAGLLVGLVVTFSTLRLRDDYLAIVTLGFAETVRLICVNEIWLTGGADGISAVPSGFPRHWGLAYNLSWLAVISACVAGVRFILRRLGASPWGRALRAIREDQIVAAVAGKRVTRLKAEAFAMSAAIAALAGALYGHYVSYVSPDIFLPLLTIYIFLAVTSGGNGRASGATLGAYLMLIYLEATRFLAEWVPGVTPLQAAALREIAVGLALILMLRFMPNGILPERNQKAPAAS